MNTLYCFLICLLFLGTLILLKRIIKNNKYVRVAGIILSVIYVCLIQLRYCMPDSFVFVINSSTGSVTFDNTIVYASHDYLQSFLRWGLGICSIVNVVAIFTDSKVFKNISVFLCLPIAIISAFYFDDFMYYFLGEQNGLQVMYNWLIAKVKFASWLVYSEFYLEIALSILLPLFILFIQKYNPFKQTKKIDLIKLSIFIVPISLLCIPMYIPQSLIGYTSFTIGPFSLRELIWMVCISLISFFIYKYYRDKEYELRYSIALFLSLTATQFYTQMFTMGHSLGKIGFFQLCNLGNYLYLICVLFKSQKLFDFMITANVLGALIALAVPDINAGFFEPWNFHFFIEHTLLLFCPFLFYGLGLFKMPEKKSFKHIILYFGIFYFICMTVGTIINVHYTNLYNTLTWEVNYFYMFNTDKITNVLGFLKKITNYYFRIGKIYRFNYLWIILQFVGYFAGMYLVWFLETKLIKVGEEHLKLANSIAIEKQELGIKTKRKVFYRQNMEDKEICLK